VAGKEENPAQLQQSVSYCTSISGAICQKTHQAVPTAWLICKLLVKTKKAKKKKEGNRKGT